MKKKSKGFTLIEMVTTLALLAVGVSMAIVVISNLVRTQNASTAQYNYSKQIDEARALINDYCSFVSLNTKNYDTNHGLSFTYVGIGENKHSITFTDGDANFSLVFEDSYLKVINNSTSELDYLKFSKNVSVPDISEFAFNFDENLAMLETTFKVNQKDYHHIAIIRGAA